MRKGEIPQILLRDCFLWLPCCLKDLKVCRIAQGPDDSVVLTTPRRIPVEHVLCLMFVSFGLVLIFVGRLLDIATLWEDGGRERAMKIRYIYVLGLSHYIPFS